MSRTNIKIPAFPSRREAVAAFPRVGDWKSLGLPRFKERLKRPESVPVALALSRAATEAEARGTLFGELGISDGGPSRFHKALDGSVVIAPVVAAHIFHKFDHHRERHANRILPTLDKSDEIWRIEHKPGEFRKLYMKLWRDKKSTLVVVKETADGNLLYNFMVRGGIDSQRKGELVYRRPEKTDEKE